MANLIQSKQIKKFITGRVHVQNVTTTNNVATITTQLTTALASASDQGTSVPLQYHITDVQPGLMMFPPKNTVEVFNRATKQKLVAEGEYEVYGRLESGGAGVYAVRLYYFDTAEQNYFLPASTVLDFVVPYMFDFYTLPADFATSLKTQFVNDDPFMSARRYNEKLTVTSLNTLSALTNKYAGDYAALNINGQVIDNLNTPLAFTILAGGTTVTWSQANAGFALETTDVVSIEYNY